MGRPSLQPLRYDPDLIADDFGARLRVHVDTVHLADDWAGVVTTTLQPTAVGVLDPG